MTSVLITPAVGEPPVDSWRLRPIETVAAELLDGLEPGRRVVAVDGRGGGGKTTLATRLARCVPAAAVVSTDDIAWNHSIFDWAEPLIDGVLRPYRAGSAVAYRPPGWVRHGREGAVEVPDTVQLLIIEGVGASRTDSPTGWTPPAGSSPTSPRPSDAASPATSHRESTVTPRRRSPSGTPGWPRSSRSSSATDPGSVPI